MRSFLLSFLLLFPVIVLAQHLPGKVIDKETHSPVIYATVTAANNTVITSYSGEFMLNNMQPGDTIRITCVGYQPYKIAFKDVHADSLIVYLHEGSIMLRDVNVRARHNFKQDSINLRKQFNDVFNYKAPGFKDMFLTVDPYAQPYNTYNTSPNNATMLVNVNLLSIVSMLSKNKNPETKLQKTLLQDEANNYVDQRFSKQKITNLTGMKGDSLANFIMMYRPSIDQTKRMNDYQMVIYIKKSYADFLKNYDPKRSLFGQ